MMEIIMSSIWEQVKQAMVESAKKVCGSVRWGKEPKSVWKIDEIKVSVRRKEAA